MDVAIKRTAAMQISYTAGEVASIYKKITWRLIAFLFICYMMSYLDRINVGFAQLQMKQDLGFGDAVYGLGAGIFLLDIFYLRCRETYGWSRLAHARRLHGSWSSGACFPLE